MSFFVTNGTCIVLLEPLKGDFSILIAASTFHYIILVSESVPPLCFFWLRAVLPVCFDLKLTLAINSKSLPVKCLCVKLNKLVIKN